MTQKPLYRSLDANLALLEEMFGRSDDFYTKRLMLAGIPCAIVMFTGLSSPEKLCHMALDMLDRDPAMLGGGEGLCDYLLTQSRVPAEPAAVEDRTALVEPQARGHHPSVRPGFWYRWLHRHPSRQPCPRGCRRQAHRRSA